MALSKTTRDHDEIRQWAEARGAVPAEVASTDSGNGPGILRFKFADAPHANDSNLEEIEWDDFFEKFDSADLELVYQEHTADGQESNFNKLIHPEHEEHSSNKRSSHTNSASGAKKSSTGAASKKASTKTSGSASADGKKSASRSVSSKKESRSA